ncbi:hypothetical protein [Fodinibius saliphilus]|uniref:hypothetical protein n=1 Tax=Fodinibius saliphilus TaxID=1920650 RepID=UPI001107BEAE|nr:hypothetical protein [Fodinibius saliphilus]
MEKTSFITKTIFSLTLAVAILTTGCGNPASSDDDHNEHTEPFGLVLVMNGETVMEYFDGKVTGHLHVEEGGATPLVTVEFLNKEREHIHDEDLGDEYNLGWNIEDESILGIEQHAEDGRWSFHFQGKSVGESRVQFQLMHGDHSDFETPASNQENAIEIHVETQSS